MKNFTAAVIFAVVASLAPASFAADLKLGYADIQKILLNSDAGKEAKDQLSQKAAKLEGEKNAKEEELKKLKKDLETQGVLLNEATRTAKEKDYQQKLKEYQRFLKDAQDDLQVKNDELTNKIVDEVVRLIQDYGKKNGYTFVLAKDNVFMIYADSTADLTDEIIKVFNSSKKK